MLTSVIGRHHWDMNMNKRRRKKAIKKAVTEAENVMAALGGGQRKKMPRLSARERRIAEAAMRKDDTEIIAAFETGLGDQGKEASRKEDTEITDAFKVGLGDQEEEASSN